VACAFEDVDNEDLEAFMQIMQNYSSEAESSKILRDTLLQSHKTRF